MAAELVAQHPAAKRLFEEAADRLGFDLLEICVNGPAERLNATDVSQPAIFVASLAALGHLQETQPEVFEQVTDTAGLSLGEYTALVFAGALSFRDGLAVVRARGQAMQHAAEATPGAMAGILGGEATEVQALVEQARDTGVIEVANLLCPGNTVISGEVAAVDRVVSLADAKGFKVARLAVAGAFHTSLMKPADDRLAEALATVEIRTPRIPVWSNVDAAPHTDPAEIRELLVRQVVSPVLWETSMRRVAAAGVQRWYEIGPGRVLAGLMKRIERKTDFHNVPA